MKLKNFLILLISTVLLIPFVSASYTYNSQSPADSINVIPRPANFTWNVTTYSEGLLDGDALNCTVHLSKNNSDFWILNLAGTNTTNNTLTHYAQTLAYHSPYYYYINCSNGTTAGDSYSVTTARTFDISYTINPYIYTPTDGSSYPSTKSINYSFYANAFNVEMGGNNTINCSVWNRTGTTGAFSQLFSMNVSNGTFANQTVSMDYGTTQWFLNCTDPVNGSLDSVSSVYSFDITRELDVTDIVPGSTTQTKRDVNFSWSITGDNLAWGFNNSVNCSIYINSSTNPNGTTYHSQYNTSNSSFINKTITLVNGVYAYLINCSVWDEPAFYNDSAGGTFQVSEGIPDTFVYTLNVPAEYEILASTSVNYSWSVAATGGIIGTESLNCSVYNSSDPNSNRNYSKLFTYQYTNNTFANQSVTMDSDSTHWWFVNCSTTYQPTVEYGISPIRLFDIEADATFLKFSLLPYYTVNWTLDTGTMMTKGDIGAVNFNASGLVKIGQNSTPDDCLPGSLVVNNTGIAGFEICACNTTGNWRCADLT